MRYDGIKEVMRLKCKLWISSGFHIKGINRSEGNTINCVSRMLYIACSSDTYIAGIFTYL